MTENKKNPWTSEDEREHYPAIMEWWAIEGFFKTTEKQKKWSVKAVFTEWLKSKKDHGSSFILTTFDLDKNKHYTYDKRKNKKKLVTRKNQHYIKFNKNSLKGLYPKYEVFLQDKKNQIELNMRLKAESLPRWIAQDITGGWLPMGLGFYRYGFIPKCEITGQMKISNKKFNIKGKGYYEHIWGNLWYDNPISSISEIGKTLSTYSKLVGWWIKNHKPNIPSTINITTENSPFGYDWVWALLDNGWAIFYGNIMFWLSKGPVFGSLILTKDGENYQELCNARFRYNKKQYSENYDFYYPVDLELNAEKQDEKIHLRFKMTNKAREYVSKFLDNKFWLALVICESPGSVEGYHSKGNKQTPLSGICKIESQRQISKLGHNSLNINILKPPEGIGLNLFLTSHFFRKKIKTGIHLLPKPSFKINFKKIKKSNLHDNRKKL